MVNSKYINIRGCNGSGKTTLLRQLVDHFDTNKELGEVVVDNHKPIPVTYLGDNVAILGDYLSEKSRQSNTAGCDRIKTQKAIKDALEAIQRDIVLFEGVIVSTIFQPWADWSQNNGGMLWAFLDTPIDVCLQRIQHRNGGKPINEQLVVDKFNGINRVMAKAMEAEEYVRIFDHRTALPELVQIIRENTHG